MKRAQLIANARLNATKDARAYGTEPFRRVIGAFTHAGLLKNNLGIEGEKAKITLDEVLWAGEFEPRLHELLPAVLIKKPGFIKLTKTPPDLETVLRQMRHNRVPDAFRGMPGEKLMEWIPKIGHKDKLPSRLKSFRFQADDVKILEELTKREGKNETEVVREALRLFKKRRRPRRELSVRD